MELDLSANGLLQASASHWVLKTNFFWGLRSQDQCQSGVAPGEGTMNTKFSVQHAGWSSMLRSPSVVMVKAQAAAANVSSASSTFKRV